MYYTYVLWSEKQAKRYIGFTEDLEERIKSHNAGEVDATRFGKPWKLIYYEAGLSREKALQREKYFKTGFGRRFLAERI